MSDKNHNHDQFWGGAIAFIVSLFRSVTEHIDGWAILQSMLCALAGYGIVRIARHLFPEKTQTK